MRIATWSKAWLGLFLLCACGGDTSSSGSRQLVQQQIPSTNGTDLTGQNNANGANPAGGFGNPVNGPVTGPVFHPPDANNCGSVDISAARILPTVMLVVDGSGSMVENAYPADSFDAGMGFPPAMVPNDKTRWYAIRKALVDPTNGVVPKLQHLVKFGLAIFGTMPTCPLPTPIIDPLLDNSPAITSAMPDTAPGLFTPTGPALSMIVDRLPDPTSTGPDQKAVGPQIIVLATDGDPNTCGDGDFATAAMTNYQPSIDAAHKLKDKHLRMYVISVGEDAGKAHLQQMANIGAGLDDGASPGAMVYYPEDPAALASTLEMLIGKELPCDVELTGRGVKMGSECKGTVTLNGQVLECNGADGWSLTDSSHIALKGAACAAFKDATTEAMLHGTFPCDAIVPL
jgi:hypothetical protein